MDFADLKPIAERQGLVAKQPIPSPTLAHFRGGRAAVDQAAYPDMDEFFADLARVYREEMAALYAAGCRYVQIDETNLPFLCDPKLRDHAKKHRRGPGQAAASLCAAAERRGARPAEGPGRVHAYVPRQPHERLGRPRAATIRSPRWCSAISQIDGFFLEYDSPRAGSFAPLRYLSGNKVAVLGLVTSKKPELETKDVLKRRIDEAARIVPLERLALSPQCGFASTMEGNRVTVDDEKRKLRLVVETAREVWGTRNERRRHRRGPPRSRW